MIILEGDLSQIESRIVFMLTGDPELQRKARLKSYEYDGHSENAALLFHRSDLAAFNAFKKADPKAAKLQRHIGKITSHGAQRAMRGAKLSESILKDLNLAVSPETCDGYINLYHQRHPAIAGSYFREVRKLVMRDKRLVNTWGRYIDFRWDRVDDELYRQAYSFLPQSENADCLNQRGLYPLHMYMTSAFGYPPNVQVHDSLVTSVAPDNAYEVARFLQHSLEQPILLWGELFTPEVNFKLGLNWGCDEKEAEGVEFKKLPSREEFTDIAWSIENRRRAQSVR